MHRVVKSHLQEFQKIHSVSDDESEQFEAFLNYIIYRSNCAENIDPKELLYEGDDPGIDGIMIFIDDSYVSSTEEVEDLLKDRRRDADVTIVFTQAKTSESWSKAEINTFESAICDFLSEDAAYPHSNYVRNAREIFDTVLRNVGKIRDGKPKAEAFFATTARASDAREILSARQAIETALKNTGYFSSVKVTLVNRDSIVDMWTAAEGQVEANLPILGNAAFPRTTGIEEGYAVTVKAKHYIDQILTDDNGKLRRHIFDENVRDFLGSESSVNKEMSDTIADREKQKRFGILNNGITIISPDIRVGGLEIYIRDFQIVNGCQTSSVLFENRKYIKDDATIMLKLIETSDPAVVDDIVRATNRQTKVDEEQFLASLDAVKALERYFEARGGDDEFRLYFERRKNQYAGQENAKTIRVFSIKEIARCVAAMFHDKPELASRYPNRVTSEMKALVFDPSHAEEIFHAAAYSLYRIKLLISNSRIDHKYFKFRWHILMALKYYIAGEGLPQLSSKKIKSKCADIESFISSGDDSTVKTLKDLCRYIVNIDEVNSDNLKSISLTGEVRKRALEFRKRTPPTKSKSARK